MDELTNVWTTTTKTTTNGRRMIHIFASFIPSTLSFFQVYVSTRTCSSSGLQTSGVTPTSPRYATVSHRFATVSRGCYVTFIGPSFYFFSLHINSRGAQIRGVTYVRSRLYSHPSPHCGMYALHFYSGEVVQPVLRSSTRAE